MRSTALAASAVVVLALGIGLAFDTAGRADPPVSGTPPVVYRTVTETRLVSRRIEGRGVKWWRNHAVRNRRMLNAQHRTLEATVRRVRTLSRARTLSYAPTVTYAIRLASAVYGVPESKMRRVAYCESTWNPYATNGRYKGLFQLGWSPFGLSPFDPVANALSAAQTVARDGSWRQWTCGGA